MSICSPLVYVDVSIPDSSLTYSAADHYLIDYSFLSARKQAFKWSWLCRSLSENIYLKLYKLHMIGKLLGFWVNIISFKLLCKQLKSHRFLFYHLQFCCNLTTDSKQSLVDVKCTHGICIVQVHLHCVSIVINICLFRDNVPSVLLFRIVFSFIFLSFVLFSGINICFTILHILLVFLFKSEFSGKLNQISIQILGRWVLMNLCYTWFIKTIVFTSKQARRVYIMVYCSFSTQT